MRTMRAWVMRIAGMFDRRARNKEVSDEIESHLEMHAADNLLAGMTAEEARRQAVLTLGGVESVKEAYRDRSSVPFLEHLLVDVRFTIRRRRRDFRVCRWCADQAAPLPCTLAIGSGDRKRRADSRKSLVP